MKHCDS